MGIEVVVEVVVVADPLYPIPINVIGDRGFHLVAGGLIVG